MSERPTKAEVDATITRYKNLPYDKAVPSVDLLILEIEALRAEADGLREALESKDKLIEAYRRGGVPSERLLQQLERKERELKSKYPVKGIENDTH